MRILARATFEGPSRFAALPLVCTTVDFGALVGRTCASLPPSFLDRLADAAPAALAEPWADHRTSVGAGLREPGPTVPELTAELARALQRSVAAEIAIAEVRRDPRPSVRHVLVGYEDVEVGRQAAWLAVALVRHALPPDDGTLGRQHARLDVPAAFESFHRTVAIHQLDLLTRLVVRRMRTRGIPVIRLASKRVVQIGWGRRQQRILSTLSGRTSAVGQAIAGDKSLTSALLREAGLPVPPNLRVGSEEAAVEAARRLGTPVVVKAIDQDKGNGVFPGLAEPKAVRAAYAAAARFGRVMIEKHVDGDDHRILVVAGRAVAVARRLAARVVGDGRRTVRALVAEVNRDPRRGTGYADVLVRIELDAEADRILREQGLDADAVPAAGRIVPLRRTANISTGGTAEDVTAEAHPDHLRIAEAAARAVGLDIAGIDLLSTDIRRPPSETGAAICEVNPMPGLRPHLLDPRSPDTVGAIVDGMLAAGTTGRILLAAVTGSNGKTTTARMLARIMRRTGAVVGLATTTGVSVDERSLADGDLAGPAGARMILLDPTVDVAVVEAARGGILRYGLGFDHCTVGALLNVEDDHVGMDGIASRAALARVKGLVVERASELAVLNAADPHCVSLRPRVTARAVCWVAADPAHPLAGPERPPDDLAATVTGTGADATIVMRTASGEVPVVAVSDIPVCDHGRAAHNVENALFATALAWGLGAGPAAIAEGLAGYDRSFETTRGRLAIHEGPPFRTIVDYGHNAGAIAAVGRYAAALPVDGRRLCMLNAPGNRENAHYARLAAAAAERFDLFWCTGPDRLRGRADGEVARRLADGLAAAGIGADRIAVVPREDEAVPAILSAAHEGDLVVLFCHDPDRSWGQVIGRG